jgi:lipopolysaccharide/colanic/teichoic acid biosynthesis glycosyltransferase
LKKNLLLTQKIYLKVKLIADPLLALVLLILLSPVFLIIAIFIKLDSKGKVFVEKHLRIGKDQRIFLMYKFRTMKSGWEKVTPSKSYKNNMFKMENDPRITRVGKVLRDLDLDELPQLINILKGDMYFIGPRCFFVEEELHYKKNFPKLRRLIDYRTHIKPGLTGLWQISGRSNTTLEKRLSLDKYYVDHFSPFLDFKILLVTGIKLLTRKWH